MYVVIKYSALIIHVLLFIFIFGEENGSAMITLNNTSKCVK